MLLVGYVDALSVSVGITLKCWIFFFTSFLKCVDNLKLYRLFMHIVLDSSNSVAVKKL